jgi:hypothetical protein
MSYHARLWKTIDRRKASYRSKMRPVFREALEKHIRPVYEKIEETSNIEFFEIPPLDIEPISDAYKRLYMSTALDFAMFDRHQAQKSVKMQIKQGEEEIYESLIMDHILVYLRDYVGSEIVAAGNTSVLLIQKLCDKIIPEIVEQGLGAGQAQTMLRDRIKSAWHEMKYFRTERIVRTEVNRAASWGSLEGIKSTEIDHDKVWLSALAQQSRDWHTAADGQKVGMNESFDIGGEALQYPGDPAGSAGNVINCLCSMTYEVKGF